MVLIDACSRHRAWRTEARARGMARRHVKRATECPKCRAHMLVGVWECGNHWHYGHRLYR